VNSFGWPARASSTWSQSDKKRSINNPYTSLLSKLMSHVVDAM
jgi:hypothetical protein